jgi:phosphoglycerol transferase MdoB-like AlkP superfamily enzyme
MKKLLEHRYGPLVLLVLMATGISFITRVALLIKSASDFDWSFMNVAGAFGLGLFYDLCAASYLVIPFVLHLWFINERIYQPTYKWFVAALGAAFIAWLAFSGIIPKEFNSDLRNALLGYLVLRLLIFLFLSTKTAAFRKKWRAGVLYFDFILVTFILIFNGISEWFFWDEFSTRYNFIAVDYLVYTNEVVGNIQESYPVIPIMLGVLAVALVIFFFIRKYIRRSLNYSISFSKRSFIALILLLIPFVCYYTVTSKWRKFSSNEYANELAGNGMFEFGVAFWNNELDFFKFYKTIPDKEAFSILRSQLASANARFVSDDVFNIEREISYAEPEKKMNVVLISVESLSASFMKYFGNDKNITPFLDSLVDQSVFFTHLYASGTRTVRGLEALSLCVPPPPGQSIVKRPGNEGLFSVGSVLRSKGYITQYIYGGYGYFDNMNYFFSNNGYDVIDRNEIDPKDIHYANIWGVADEDLFTLAIRKLDSNYKAGKPFFSQIMTVSNHRPYTYPDGRIDIPPTSQTRDGAVKYTDYAIGKFLREAKNKPWFNNTIFVIVADHCASSAGKVQLPVTGYHIPLWIYSPANLQPQKVDRMMAQIDIMPTVMGMMKMNYRTKFFGQDIFSLPAGRERAFISTYQGLGYLRNDRLLIQSPVKRLEEFIPDYKTGKAEKTHITDSLSKQAIAYYQCISWLINNKKYKP